MGRKGKREVGKLKGKGWDGKEDTEAVGKEGGETKWVNREGW